MPKNSLLNNRPAAAAFMVAFLAVAALAALLIRDHAANRRAAGQAAALAARLAALEQSTRATAATLARARVDQNARADGQTAAVERLQARVETLERVAADALTEVVAEIRDIHKSIAPGPGFIVHDIQPGDTLESIVAEAEGLGGTTPEALKLYNPLVRDWSNLAPDEGLRIEIPLLFDNLPPPAAADTPPEK
ncbi:MAG: LysM peptidoglycan-binding domain-containing protein [Opitutaceae bacterium]|nr:LysM peptidoglycan-binding domain-containing protein [Opitutaceae bacterium]